MTFLKTSSLTLAASLAAASSFAAVVPTLPSGSAYEMHAPQLTTDLGVQLARLKAEDSPEMMASALTGMITAPGATPTEFAAARVILEAIEKPANIPALRSALAGPQSKKVGDSLLSVAALVHAGQGQNAFRAIAAKMPALESEFGVQWPASKTGDVKARLDAFFAGAVQSCALTMDGPVVDGAGAKSVPDEWALKKPKDPMKESFGVTVGGKAQDEKIELKDILAAIDSHDSAFLDRFLPQGEAAAKDRLVKLSNAKGRVSVTMASDGSKEDSRRMLWADFFESDKHPLLGKLAQKFTFAQFQRQALAGEVDYEAPSIDGDTMQLTTYGLRLGPGGAIENDETTHIYVGKDILVTTHDKARPSVEKAAGLLAETGRYMEPKEMMVFMLGSTINRYSGVIDSLSKDFSLIAEKAGHKDRDDSILQDTVRAGRKIDLIHETVLRQRQVLKDLLSINEFHRSEFVPVAALEKRLEALDHHLTVLDHYQERKNGLIELYRAKVSNELDEAMKRLASMSMLVAPAAIVGSLMGMNILIPGSTLPHVFWIVIGVISAVTAGLFVSFRRKKWL